MNQSSSGSTLLAEAPWGHLVKAREDLKVNPGIVTRIRSSHEGSALLYLPTETRTICSRMFAGVCRSCPPLSNCSACRLQLALGNLFDEYDDAKIE